jgi:hypothetical protein
MQAPVGAGSIFEVSRGNKELELKPPPPGGISFIP